MRKVLRIVLGIASVIAVPIFIDFFVFGNAFHFLAILIIKHGQVF